jgi:hypothetical protein
MRIIVKQVSDYFQPLSIDEAEEVSLKIEKAVLEAIDKHCLDRDMGVALLCYVLGNIAADSRLSSVEVTQLVANSYKLRKGV